MIVNNFCLVKNNRLYMVTNALPKDSIYIYNRPAEDSYTRLLNHHLSIIEVPCILILLFELC